MAENERKWGRFEELRPDELQSIVEQTPIAYWPLGLLEHHGWALPVGFDGVKADRFCTRMANDTGGAVLPCMWWGSGGGHGDFKWTFYQDPDAGAKVLDTTVRKLIDFGFRAIVVYAGHYPWQETMDNVLPAIKEEHPEVIMFWGFECTLVEVEPEPPGDHASRWETAYGLALLPDLIDMNALRPGRTEAEAWPPSRPNRRPDIPAWRSTRTTLGSDNSARTRSSHPRKKPRNTWLGWRQRSKSGSRNIWRGSDTAANDLDSRRIINREVPHEATGNRRLGAGRHGRAAVPGRGSRYHGL